MITASEIYDRLQNKIRPYFEMINPYLCLCQNICGIYLLWVFVHFISSHMYIRFCNPSTFIGFIMSPFMAAAPHCQALRWAIYNGGNNIVSMWITVGVWLMSYFPLFQRAENMDVKKTEKIE